MRIAELSKKYGYSRSAICRIVKLGFIKAKKVMNYWDIEEEDYQEYLNKRYIRKSTLEHQQNRNYSPRIASEMIKVPIQIMYYNIRRKNVKAFRHGSAWYIAHEDLMTFKDKHAEKKIKKKMKKRKVLKHIMHKKIA